MPSIPRLQGLTNVLKAYGPVTALKASWAALNGRPVESAFPGAKYNQAKKFASPYYYGAYSEWLRKHAGRISPDGATTDVFRRPSVAIVADLNLPQCKKYRVLQKIEAFRKSGVDATYAHWMDQPRAISNIQCATHVLFYRIPASGVYEFYLQEAKRLGATTFYDLDDPIFDRDVYGKNKSLDFLAPRERKHLIGQSEKYAAAISRCDVAIASTPGMQALMEKNFSMPVALWRNLVDLETAAAAERINQTRSISSDRGGGSGGGITIGYASGSRAHEADFREATPALAEIFARHGNVRLKALGYVTLPDELKPYEDRIDQIPFGGVDAYLFHVSTFDINMVPLCIDAFNECKSAIRFYEAAAVLTPSIVSRTGDFKHVVKEGETGLFAETRDDWIRGFDALIRDPALRAGLAGAAYVDVMRRFSVHGVPDTAAHFFETKADRDAVA